jgi:hypothetical protein
MGKWDISETYMKFFIEIWPEITEDFIRIVLDFKNTQIPLIKFQRPIDWKCPLNRLIHELFDYQFKLINKRNWVGISGRFYLINKDGNYFYRKSIN